MKKITVFIIGLAGASSAAAAINLTQPQTFQTAEWTTTVTIASIDAPTLPPEAHQGLRSIFEALAGRQCLGGRSEDIARDFRDSLTQGFTANSPGTCTFDPGDTFDGGVIRSRATCRKEGATVTVSADMSGTYDARSMSLAFELTGARPGDPPDQPALRIRASIVTRAGGPCSPQA